MLKDPDYLSELGELATLKNAIACSFHQDAFDIHGNMDALVRDFWDSHGVDSAALLKTQLQTLLQRDNQAIQSLWDKYSDWITGSSKDTRKIFETLLAASPHSG